MSPLDRLRKAKQVPNECIGDAASDGHSSPDSDVSKRTAVVGAALASIAEKLTAFAPAEKAHLEAIFCKYILGKSAKHEKEELLAKGLIDAPNEPSASSDLPHTCGSKAALCGLLNKHFAGKISIDLSPQLYNFWQKGQRLPLGAPPPPVKSGHNLMVRQTAQWIEKWILPKHSVEANRELEAAGGKKDLFQLAAEAEAKRKIIEFETATLDNQVATGAFQSADLFRANLRYLGTVLNSAITSQVEKTIAQKLNASVAEWKIGSEREIEITQKIAESAQQAADALREALKGALDEAVAKVT
jgi:hypothetical protein